MFYDLHTPFPSASSHATSSASSSSAAKQPSKKQLKKAAAGGPPGGDDWRKKQAEEDERKKGRDCWFGVPSEEREKCEGGVRMARHFGYSVLAFTQTAHSRIEAPTHYNPFNNSSHVPFPSLDPRYAPQAAAGLGGRGLVQLSRLHLILDDASMGTSGCGFLAQNTSLLSQYDVLSVQPTTLQTFILACLTLSVPGPNQISIITLDFSTFSRLPFHLKRKPVLQALRLGVVFEILYSPLLPSPTSFSTQPSQARQTTLSTAHDLVRITRGKGIIISSGGEGGWGGLRGSGDVVNLGTIMGLKPNLAYAAVVLTPKKVVLRAQARKTFRGVISLPRVVVDNAPEEGDASEEQMQVDEAGQTM